MERVHYSITRYLESYDVRILSTLDVGHRFYIRVDVYFNGPLIISTSNAYIHGEIPSITDLKVIITLEPLQINNNNNQLIISPRADQTN